jgi:hypothetical protein
MRYVLAIAFVCAINTPAAFAMPTLSTNHLLRAVSTVQVVKHTRPRTSHVSRRNNVGGIHPLVGSGDY